MNKKTIFNDYDRESLTNLQEYVNTVNNSILTETGLGIVRSIGENIDNNTIEKINADIINIPNTKVETPFKIDTRCLFTSKTEYSRAINTGLLQAYNNYNIIEYDWITTGLPNVCKQCHSIEANSPYTLNEIINLLPVHINCSCSVKARLPNNLHLNSNQEIIDLTPKR